MRSGRGKAISILLLGLGALWAAEALRAAADPARRAAAARPGGAPASIPASTPASLPAVQPGTFRVASYNILYENHDLKGIAETIRKADADAVLLQETNAASEKHLREQLGKTYPHAAFHPSGGGASGLGILSKTPLRDLKVLPAKFGWFGTQICEANLAGRPVQLVNVHLIATIPRAGASAAEVLRLWSERETVRAKEIAFILENTDPNRPRLIGGDFNAVPNGTAPRFLREKGFLDSLASCRQDHAKVTTWSGSPWRVQLAFRVDYIFHTKDLQTTDCQVLPCAASDHYLVASTLRWAAAASRPDANRPAGGERIP